MSSIPSTTGWKVEDYTSDYILYSKGDECIALEIHRKAGEIYTETVDEDGNVKVTNERELGWGETLAILGITQDQVDERQAQGEDECW